MTRPTRRIAPLLPSSAFRTEPQKPLLKEKELDSQSDGYIYEQGKDSVPLTKEDIGDLYPVFRPKFIEAQNILDDIKPPSISSFARLTRKPKGALGTIAYYARQTFTLLFMSGPPPTTSFTTDANARPTKLGGSLAKAVKLLEEEAAEDNPNAMFFLGEMNFYGNWSHPVNYTRAFDWYSKLADLNGDPQAQYMIGFIYATGLDPARRADQARSMLYHTFAADQGYTRSEMTLGYRHHEGIATPRNCGEAVHWYKRVAEKAVKHYRSGPPGGFALPRDSYRIADENGGVYGEGASVSSSGLNAKMGGPTSDQHADIEDVLEYLYLQSAKGDLKMTFGLAKLQYDGARGMKPDFKLAKEHFLLVARQYWSRDGKINKGVTQGTERLASKAAGYLGRMFMRGEGMAQDFAKARIWLTRGVANGDALSQYSLGLMYLNGFGVKKDVVKAAQLFSAAADQDLAVAQTNLGMLFLDQDETTTAIKYFELAARSGHIEAFYYLAEMADKGIGRDRSCGLAAGYYKLVAEKTEVIWGTLSETNAAYNDGDLQTAILGYLMAAEQGSEAAQANVAWLLDQTQPRWSPVTWLFSVSESTRSAISDAALSLMYWTRSAKQKNVDSLVKMGDYYLAGLGASISAENAAACYQAAADSLQSAQAMWNLGWMHENGIGITQDFHLAKRYYDSALETNREAYLPVKLSLWRLRWRSWWNDVTHGSIKGIQPEDDGKKKKRSFAEWLNEFLENDALAYYDQYDDDWTGDGDGMVNGDDYWDGTGADEIDEGVLETLLIGGLIAALGGLIWYRGRRQAAEQRRRELQNQQQNTSPNGEGGAGAGPAPAAAQGPDAPPLLPGQQPDGGFFPQPNDPNFGQWVAGGIGI